MDETLEDKVNACLQLMLETAIEAVAQDKLTASEAARVRLQLSHPSELLEAVREDAEELIVEALDEALTRVMNCCLFPDDVES